MDETKAEIEKDMISIVKDAANNSESLVPNINAENMAAEPIFHNTFMKYELV